MALIRADIDRVRGAIDRRIFGFFTEHLRRIIYNGIYEPDSPLSDSDGFRKDVIDALKTLHPATLRWPGGNFASAYDWTCGVSPERQPVYDPVWMVVEPNTFGTDEFVKYCRKVGAEPYICVNLGDGSQREAMRWVEYCNGKPGTDMADRRVKNGAAEPYGVKYWGLGNELCGDWQIGHKSAAVYATGALEYAKAMRLIDPAIELVAAGGIHMRDFERVERNWDRVILEKLAGVVDFVGLHFYARRLPVSSDEGILYRQHMAEPEWLDMNIRLLKNEIQKAEYHMSGKDPRRIKIAVDELGVCNAGEVFSDLQDALVSACLMNTLLNNADIVALCSYTSIANIFSPVFTCKNDMVLQTFYYPMELFARLASGNALNLYVDSPVFDSDALNGLPLLHSSAAYDPEKGTVTLFVVNRSPEADIDAQVECRSWRPGGPCEIYEVNGLSLAAANTFDDKQNVCTKTKSVDVDPGQKCLTYVFPAHSFTAMKFTTDCKAPVN